MSVLDKWREYLQSTDGQLERARWDAIYWKEKYDEVRAALAERNQRVYELEAEIEDWCREATR